MSQVNEQSQVHKDQQSNTNMHGVGEARRPFGRQRGRAPVVKAKNFRGTLKRLWHYFGQEKQFLGIALLLIVIDSLLTLLVPYLIGMSVDNMAMNNSAVNSRMLEITVLALTVAYIVDGVLTFFQGWLMAGISQRIVMKLRCTLFAKLQKLPIVFFDRHSHGEVMSRLSNDIDNVSGTISYATVQLMSGLIMISGSLVMMIILSPLLTVVSVMTVPLVALLAHLIAKKTRNLFKDQQVQLGKLNRFLVFNYEDKIGRAHV